MGDALGSRYGDETTPTSHGTIAGMAFVRRGWTLRFVQDDQPGGDCNAGEELFPMDVPVSGKVAERGLLKKVEFRVDSAQVRPYSDQAFDNLYMFDLVAVSLFRFILSPKRGLKPGSRLVPVNMSNDTMHKTLYERIYKAACLLPRHPVVMESYAQSSFLDV